MFFLWYPLAECYSLCFKLWDNSRKVIATSNTVKVHHGRHRHSNSSTSSADAIREHRTGSDDDDDDDDAFKRYEHIRRTLSHSRRRYSTIQRKHRAKKEALKQSNNDNVIVASGNYQTNTLPHSSKQDDMEASLMLDRDSSAQADLEMEQAKCIDQENDVDDSVKASKIFSSFKRGIEMCCTSLCNWCACSSKHNGFGAKKKTVVSKVMCYADL